MGLNLTHGCWDGAYSSFHQFRAALAKAAGIPLDLMEGYWQHLSSGDERVWRDAVDWASPRSGGPWCSDPRGPLLLSYIEKVDQWLPLSWAAYDDDPLVDLLDHSDCDGQLDVDVLEPLADRLDELIQDIEDDYNRDRARQFAVGLRLAAKHGEPVEFH